MRLTGRTAIVTGGARNIGREYCLGLAREGANVVVADIRDPSETAALVKALGGSALGIVVDIADEASVAGMTAEAIAAFGRIDVLVNNAALYGDLKRESFDKLSVDTWDLTMRVNLRGVFLTMREILPLMRSQGGGSIINISSASIYGLGGSPHYIASKAGIIGLTRSAAREFGRDNIRVNAVAPGFTMSQASEDKIARDGLTGMRDAIVAATALGRVEQPVDLVGTVTFLASDDSAFITGQTINVDGGWIMN